MWQAWGWNLMKYLSASLSLYTENLHAVRRIRQSQMRLTWDHESSVHDEVMRWKHFLYNWPIVTGNHQSLVVSPHSRPVMPSFDVFFDISLNNLLCWTNNWIVCNLRGHNTHINGLMQERRKSIADALELHLSCTKSSKWLHCNVQAWGLNGACMHPGKILGRPFLH